MATDATLQTRPPVEKVETRLRGSDLLHDPFLNKGTAFSLDEREAFGLLGLLPLHQSTIWQQLQRVHENITRKTDPLERYIGLASLQDRNEHLFYRLLLEHTEELLPIVYTPVVGQAAQRFSHIFRRARGLWITPEHRGRIRELLANAPVEKVRLIVVTDNERILGLGDQGAGGMAISIGKLVLYTLGAGIHPLRCLPISLDVGTDNEELLNDDLYLGWRHRRLRGQPYLDLVDELVDAVRETFPKALLQWEDFKKVNAFCILERYRDRILCFNDDIQGTAAVGLAGWLAAARVSGTPLTEQRIVIAGAGAAGAGIAGQIGHALEREGLDREAVRRRIAVLDSRGLLVAGEPRATGEAYKDELAWTAEIARSHGLDLDGPRDLAAVVAAVRPTALFGVTGQPHLFDEPLVRRLAAEIERPAIFPLSNPTSKSEAKPADLLAWTDGRALVGTGSPFDPVRVGDGWRRIGQANNVFVFPGVGLGALLAGAVQVTEGMFTAAALALAEAVTEDDLDQGALYPHLADLRGVSTRVAAAVIREARHSGAAAESDADPRALVEAAMWEPDYPELILA